MDITINEVTFALPCKSFFIDFSVSKKRTLPVVKEFVIRYIYTLESVAASTLSSFFGFNSQELLNVLEDLKEESLIVWQADEIRLSRYALDRFEEAGSDGIPRFFEVTDEFATVTFDLMSYRLITKRTEAHNSPNAIEVKLQDDAYKNPSSKANRAFNTQFGVYLEEVLQLDPLNDWMELYKINSVTPKDDKILPLKIKLFVDTEKVNQLCVEYSDDWVIDWDKTGGILGEIQKNLNNGSLVVNSSLKDIADHCSATDDPILSRFFLDDSLDLHSLLQYVTDIGGLFDSNTRLIIGNLYLEENIEIFHSLLDEAVGQDNKIQSPGAIWCVDPDRKMWGRSSDFAYFAKRVQSRLDERFKPRAISLCLSTSSRQLAKAYRDLFWRSDVEFQGINSSYCGSQTELFVIPGIIVASIFHLADERFGSQTIPVGYVSTDSRRIDLITSRFGEWISNDINRNTFFENQRNSDESVFNKVTQRIFGIK